MKGKYALLLNTDTVLTPEAVNKVMELLRDQMKKQPLFADNF